LIAFPVRVPLVFCHGFMTVYNETLPHLLDHDSAVVSPSPSPSNRSILSGFFSSLSFDQKIFAAAQEEFTDIIQKNRFESNIFFSIIKV
jgi:hypothetical protein